MGENPPAAGENPPPPGLNGEAAENPGVLNGVAIGVPGPFSPPLHSSSNPLMTCCISDGSYSIASLNFFSSRINDICPLPSGANWPSIIFSVTPVNGSPSANIAASIKISTVSSKEHRTNGPESTRLIPCRVTAIKCPRNVMTSANEAK